MTALTGVQTNTDCGNPCGTTNDDDPKGHDMATTVLNVPEQGQLVRVRSRQWVVNEVKPSTLPPPAMKPSFDGSQNLITLSSVEDDGLGEELQVVWEVEPGATVIEKVALPEPTDFDHPDKLDAFLDAVRWGAASAADLKNIQSPFRSGIEIEDYQPDPAALSGTSSQVL